MKNLYVGIDLGIKGPHRASVYSPQEERYLDKSFSFNNSFEGFEHLLRSVKEKVPTGEDCTFNFIMEPTSLSWMPLSCFLVSHGFRVYRVTTQKSSDLRKFLDKHTKSDRVDARALAQLPIVAKEKVYELYLPSTELGALSRTTRHVAKLIQQAASRKVRIQNVFSMINPGALEVFGEEKFTLSGRVFFRHFIDPYKIVSLGKEGFARKFQQLCPVQVDGALVEKIYEVSLSTTKIYDSMLKEGTLPFDYHRIEEEIGIELDLLEAEEEKITELRATIKALYEQIDPEGYLMTPQGISTTIAPAILGIIGDVSRFHNIDAFRAYFGFIPKKKQSAAREKRGLGIHKAAQRLLKKYIFLAAEVARQYDPEFAAFYDRLMKKGHHHYQAICALANKMAGRVYALLKRMQRAKGTRYTSCRGEGEQRDQLKPEEVSYKLRDLQGNVIDKKEARRIVQQKFPSKSQKKLMNNQAEIKYHPTRMRPEKGWESTTSQRSLSDQPRQFPRYSRVNSSMRSGKTLPIGIILKDTFPELFFQHKIYSNGKKLGRTSDFSMDLSQQNEPVDKLYKLGEEKT